MGVSCFPRWRDLVAVDLLGLDHKYKRSIGLIHGTEYGWDGALLGFIGGEVRRGAHMIVTSHVGPDSARSEPIAYDIVPLE